MVELETKWATHGDITFISGQLDNRTTVAGVEAHLVTVEPQLDGEIWPPVEQNMPAASWQHGQIQVTVPVGSIIGIGVAGRGKPNDTPLKIIDVDPTETQEQPTTPTDILRELGDPRPADSAIPRKSKQSGTQVEQPYTIETTTEQDSDPTQDRQTIRERLQALAGR